MTTPTDTITQTLQNLCELRRLKFLNNIPPQRLMLTSPYEGSTYTQGDLDMRRKAEILAYKSNKTSNQTNSLTRSERWAQIVRGRKKNNTEVKLITTTNATSASTLSTSVSVNSVTDIAVGQTVIGTGIPNGTTVNSIDSDTLILTLSGNASVPNNTVLSFYNIIPLYCPSKRTPTSSCGVPGPIIDLYKDDTVPLYNYATNVDAYAILNNPLENTTNNM